MKFTGLEACQNFALMGLTAFFLISSIPTTADSARIVATDAAIAVVVIPAPRTANLLMLRGISGRGTAHFRIDGQCYAMQVRFVAGDFNGTRISVKSHGPIQLRVVDPAMIDALFNGQDLVSDMVVTGPTGASDAHILIDFGLSVDTGFVIDPGRNPMADMFGVRKTRQTCDVLEKALAPT